MPVPVYESAFALARRLEENGERERVKITIVSPTTLESELMDTRGAALLNKALDTHQIEFLPNLQIESLTQNSAMTRSGAAIKFDLLMLMPPFRGSSAASYVGITNEEGYINVASTMRVDGCERIYAVGDCTNFDGPKMGHMAVRQAEVAATNLAAEIDGRAPVAHYQHEMKFVIDEIGANSLYLHKDLSTDKPATVRQSYFWSWAKQAHEKYWKVSHS